MAKGAALKRRTENEVEFGRIVAFSDGVFSIAITLLVLNLGIDKGLTEGQIDNELWAQRETFLAYAISFAVIGRFWLVHHRFFAEVEAFDGLYLGWIVLIPFSSEVLGEYGGKTPAVALYSVNLAVVVMLGFLMGADSRRRGLSKVDDLSHCENQIRSAYIAGIFLLSVPLAFVAPSVAPFLWLVLFVDPSPRLARRGSAPDQEGDRPARPRA